MVWIAAASILAEVIQKTAVRYRLHQMLVDEAMHAVMLLEKDGLTVASAAMGARPYPAAVRSQGVYPVEEVLDCVRFTHT